MSRVFLTLLFGVLVLPMVMALLVSLGADRKVAFPPDDLTLKWYGELLLNKTWRSALINSLTIATFAALLSIALALPLCYHMWQRPSWFNRLNFGLSLSPFLLPPVILAIGAGVFWVLIQTAYTNLHLPLNWIFDQVFNPVFSLDWHIEKMPLYFIYGKMFTTIISHGVLLLPLATLIISRGFNQLSQEVIEASRTLGATPTQQFRSVILPLVLPFVLTGFVLVFIVSLNEYLIAFRVSGVSVETLPIRIFNEATRGGFSPILPAGAVLFSILTIVSLVILSFFTDLLKLFGSDK